MRQPSANFSLNNAILSHEVDITDIAVLPTQPLCEVEIGVAAPRRADRSPAADAFLSFALSSIRKPDRGG